MTGRDDEPEAVRIARRVVSTGNIHDSGPRIDILARVVLEQHAELERLREGLKEALEMGATYFQRDLDDLRKSLVPYDWACTQCGGCGYGFHACEG